MLISVKNALRTVLSTPRSSALTAFIVLYLVAVQYFRIVAAPDPSSLFVNIDRAYETRYSKVRSTQAEDFITKAGEILQTKGGTDASICIGIATIQRDDTKYFIDLVGSLLDGLSDRERRDLLLMPFIANVDPEVHQAFKEAWLHNVADKILTYETVPDEDRSRLRSMENPEGHREKALFDYAYMLDGCMNTTAPYLMMLEDDVLAMDGWYGHTKLALKDMESRSEFHKSLYLRLFYDTGLQGWNSEFWPYYLFWSSIFEIFLVGSLYLLRHHNAAAHEFLTPRATNVTLFICTPLCIALYFAAGRLTVQPNPRGIHRMDAFGCCSQAFVFPREQVPPLIEYFREKKIGFRDSLTEQYSDERGMARWALTPSVFQHIGSKSSKWGGFGSEITDRYGRTVTQNIWNFQFEKWNAEKLEREHKQQVRVERRSGEHRN